LIEPLVRTVIIEMAHVLAEEGVGVSLVVDQYSVGALGAHAADEPFAEAVRPRALGRDFDCVDAFGSEDSIEGVGGVESRSRIRKRSEAAGPVLTLRSRCQLSVKLTISPIAVTLSERICTRAQLSNRRLRIEQQLAVRALPAGPPQTSETTAA
jgi:hypothetical protein